VGIIAFDYRGEEFEKQESPGEEGSLQSSSLTPLRGNNRVHRENSLSSELKMFLKIERHC